MNGVRIILNTAIRRTPLQLGICLMAVLFLSGLAHASTMIKLAYSKRLGAEVFVETDSNGHWCKRLVKVKIVLADGSPLIEQGVNTFFKKMVTPELDKACPEIELAVITVSRSATGHELASVEASKEDGWNFDSRNLVTQQSNVIAGLSAATFVLLLLFFRFRRKRKPSYEPEVVSVPDLTHQQPVPAHTSHQAHNEPESKIGVDRKSAVMVVCPAYNRRKDSIPSQGDYEKGGATEAGLRGEAEVLEVIRTIGGGMTYWGLGLSINDRRCELDALVITQHGLLHVEVKNLWGKWSPTRASDTNYVQWKRESDGKVINSPIRQADRARRLIGDAAKQICYDHIPVHSVVVVTNENFEFTGKKDDRVTLMRLGEFEKYYQDFAYGYGSTVAATTKQRLARLVLYIANDKQYPVFYDLASLSDDDSAYSFKKIETDKDYIGALQHLIRKTWKCDTVRPKKWIWFGSTADMAPPEQD